MDDHNQRLATITKSMTPHMLWIGGLLRSICESYKQIVLTVLLRTGRKKHVLWFSQFLIDSLMVENNPEQQIGKTSWLRARETQAR